ncbi:amidohydrolase family protein [Novosphingobium sp. FSY-8]|uniref:Amidohydrolase family protein n=1 Tax=Novosphingobium ovatum TaxID=1908523 RepID=A0ABW9XBM2_9SPHN|nr:amidohydrolase family protein [Novosphingobium ovatum]NBC35926.1 amidohydrolase family protein [Novosphingobium ovatum]
MTIRSILKGRIRRSISVSAVIVGAAALTAPALAAPAGDPPPVIDVHVHAGEFPGGGMTVCPNAAQFLASDPKGPEAPFGWSGEDCSPRLYPSAPGQYLSDVAAEMKRLNVTAVVFGKPDDVKKFMAAAPGRVIPGTGFNSVANGADPAQLKMLELAFTEGGFKVMGEIGLQYEGISPSDERAEPYFALAEKLDIPVAIHMGTGGSGRANVAMPKFRGSMGNPLLLEELLARHPKLRVWIMHAGYPMAENLLTLLQANSHVHVDIAGLVWSYPLKEVNAYIKRIVDGGFGDRIMFGTDQMMWPKLMAYSISIVQNADYLTPQQKRDILYNNAARFLRLPAAAQPAK